MKIIYLSRSHADSIRMTKMHQLIEGKYKIDSEGIYIPDNVNQNFGNTNLEWTRIDEGIFGVKSKWLFILISKFHNFFLLLFLFKSVDILFADYSTLKGSPVYYKAMLKLQKRAKVTYILPHGSGNVFHAMHLNINIPYIKNSWNIRVHELESNESMHDLVLGDPFFLHEEVKTDANKGFDIVVLESGSISHYLGYEHVEDMYNVICSLDNWQGNTVVYAGHPRNVRVGCPLDIIYGKTSDLIGKADVVISDCFTSLLAEIHYNKKKSLIYCPPQVVGSYVELLKDNGFNTFRDILELQSALENLDLLGNNYNPKFSEYYNFRKDKFLIHFNQQIEKQNIIACFK